MQKINKLKERELSFNFDKLFNHNVVHIQKDPIYNNAALQTTALQACVFYLWYPGSLLALSWILKFKSRFCFFISRSLLKRLQHTAAPSHLFVLIILCYYFCQKDNYAFTDVVDQNPLNTLVFALGLLLPDTFTISRICLFTIAISI